MSQVAVICITIAVYVILMVVIGILNSKSASGGVANFTVGKRDAGAWITALSYGTAYFSAVMFIGYSGQSGWNLWLWAVLIGISNAIFGSWLAWKVLASRTRDVSRRLHIKSMPQFFFLRFGSNKMRVFAAVVIFIFLTPYSASVYNGLTSVCHVVLGIDENLCRIIIAVVAALLLFIGGYTATLKADFVQGIIMFVGVILLIYFVFVSPKVNGVEGLKTLTEKMRTEADGILPLSSQNTVSLIATIILTSFGTWGLPQMIHKYYSIRDEKEVKRGTVISTIFAIVVAGGGYFIGSLSHLFYNNLSELPTGGTTDYLVPYMLLDSDLPVILLGVILVLLISASVSTLSSITLTACTSAVIDLVKNVFAKNMSDKSAARLIRIFCLLFVGLSYLIAITKTPIFDMMAYSWGIISGSFLAPYLVSLYYKKITKAGGWAAMLSGFVVAMVPAVAKIITLIFGCTEPENIFVYLAGKGAVFAVAAMVISFIACFVVSKLTYKKHLDENIDKTEYFFKGEVTHG